MNKFVLFVTLSSFLTLSAHSAEANKPTTGRGSGGGWRESYGGDSTIMEFKHLAKEVAFVLNERKFSTDAEFDISTLKSIINNSHVECGSHLVLDGASKDAINYPHENPQKIIFDCKKWNSELSTAQKYRLAIHEYLPLAGGDDSSYALSEKMFNFYTKNKNSSNIKMTEMMATLTSCNIKSFRNMTDMGANVFLESPAGSNFLQIAVELSCNDIVQDLIDAGLEYVVNEGISQLYGHYRLIESALSPKYPGSKVDALATLKTLINKWPALTTLGFPNLIWMLNTTYTLNSKCFEKSTIMHLLASKSNTTEEDVIFIKQLEQLGFSLDQKNTCGQTPRSLFENNGIKF